MYNAAITRDISADDCYLLAQHMRPEEVAEVWASSAKTPEEAVFDSVERSYDTFAAWQGDTLLCMSGVWRQTSLANKACPWLLTTTAMKKNPRALLYYSKQAIDGWKKEFKVLTNMVDARYTQSLRWAERVGFQVSKEPEPFGPFNLPFHRITIGS